MVVEEEYVEIPDTSTRVKGLEQDFGTVRQQNKQMQDSLSSYEGAMGELKRKVREDEQLVKTRLKVVS